MPVQAIGSGAAAALGARRSRASITAAAAVFSAFGCARSAGRPTTRPVLFAANHISYLDITVLGSLIAGSFIAKTEVAGWPLFGWLAQAAAHGVRRPPGAQHRASARRDRRAARRRRGADPVSRGDERRRQPRPAVQERAVQRRRSCAHPAPVTVQPVSIAYTRLDGMPLGRALRPFFAWYGAMSIWRRICGGCWGWARLEVVVEFHPPTSLADLRLAQGAGALLRGAHRGGPGRRVERASRDAGARRAVRRTALARRCLMPFSGHDGGTRADPDGMISRPRRFTS